MKQPETDDPARGAVRAIAAGLARAQDAPGCPDPTDLAAFAEGGLPRARRLLVEGHLALCGDCRSVVATLLQAAPAAVRPHRRPAPAFWWLAAAVLLLALGAAFWPGGGATLVRQLEMAAADLRSDAPELSAFQLLGEAELAERPPIVRGADAALWIHPSGAGLIRDPRPALVLEGAGAESIPFRLEVVDAIDGTSLGAADGRLAPLGDRLAAEWPLASALPQDRSCGLNLVLRTPAGERTMERIVTTASSSAVAAYDRGAAAIDSRHRDDLGPALQAHHALRARFLREAEQAALALRARLPAEPAAAALLRHVRARLGVPDQE